MLILQNIKKNAVVITFYRQYRLHNHLNCNYFQSSLTLTIVPLGYIIFIGTVFHKFTVYTVYVFKTKATNGTLKKNISTEKAE